jgi:hypothetical protein
LNRRVFVRDSIELVVAIGMAGVFLWIATLAPVMWPWMAAAVVVLGVGGVFVRERMRAAQRVAYPADVRRGLERAIEEADHQIRLLSTVAVWYLAPLLAAVVPILVGTVLGARAEMGPDVWARARAGIIAAANLFWLCYLAGRALFVLLLPFASNGRECWRNDTRNGTRLDEHRRDPCERFASEFPGLTRRGQLLQALEHVRVLPHKQDERGRLVVRFAPPLLPP